MSLVRALSEFSPLSEFFEPESLSQTVKRTAFSEFRADNRPVNSKLLRRTHLIAMPKTKPRDQTNLRKKYYSLFF